MHAFTERAAGERLFVDYAGATFDVVCPKTGEVRTVRSALNTPVHVPPSSMLTHTHP